MAFNENLQAAQQQLHDLGEQVNGLVTSYETWLKESSEYPLEIRESKDEIAAKKSTRRKECIRLEELLTRVQLSLDNTKLPRKLIDGKDCPDPEARAKRKEIVQEAENIIKQLHKLKNNLSENTAKL